MKRIVGMGLGVAAAVALTLPTGAAVAAPGDHGQGVGGCIDVLYGNATNERESGHGVLPSQSPGPWLNSGDRKTAYWGPSMGALIQEFGFSAGQLRGIDCPF